MKLSISALLAASSTLLTTNVFAEIELAQLDPSQVTIKKAFKAQAVAALLVLYLQLSHLMASHLYLVLMNI